MISRSPYYAAATGNPLLIAIATLNAGLVAYQMGDLPRAEALLTEALHLHQRYNGPYAAAFAQGWLAEVILARGDMARAVALFRDAITGFAASGNWAVVAEHFEALARGTVTSHAVPTVQLLGAAAAMRERFGHPRKPSEGPDYDRLLATARAKLGDTSFSEAWDAGRQLSEDQVLAEVNALVAATTDAPTGHPPSAPTDHGLTRREAEVRRLLAEGRSHRAIAETRSLSERTVESHVLPLLPKLGLASRPAAATYAVRHGLV